MRLPLLLSGVLSLLVPLTTALTYSDVLAQSVGAYARQWEAEPGSSLAARDLVSDILDDIEDLAECSACQGLLVVLQALAHVGNDAFTDTIVAVCVALQIEDDDVCAGAIGLEGPILAHDLRNMDIPSTTSELFCLTIFGLCQWPAVDTSYSVSLSAAPAGANTRPAPSGQTPLQIVHISDIHVDRNYTAGSSYNCTKNICCRAYTADDAVGVTDYPAGAYGNPACDSPVTLEESLYAAIVALVPNRAFTIFTGDVIAGDVWETTDAEVTGGLDDAYARMAAAAADIGQTYAVVGNHDSCPVDSFPPAAVDTTYAAETQLFYDALAADIAPWIGSAAAADAAANYGSYSVLDAATGLRLISVNTNFWYKSNYWMYEATMEHDPSGLLAWLAGELEAAEAAGERVWLMGHMPLGSTDAFHDQSYYFDTIVQRFAGGTLAAVFYGHTHKDEFEIAYSDYADQTAETATMMSYIAPALTPTSGNPTFRVYDVDPVTFGILDMTTYYANISAPTYQTSPTWQKLYSVKETYGALLGVTDAAAELTPAFWHNVTALFESDDAVFQEYYARKTRDYSTATCTGTCKTAEICQLRAAQAQYNCGTVTPGINLRRRQLAQRALPDTVDSGDLEEHACEASVAQPVLSSIYSTEGLSAFQRSLVDVAGASFLNTTVEGNYTVSN
ncbi:calcineurin-like phosphoesterase [Coniella lustricola]|uniref:Sphingomyelin phosphodiesterase n=1 Tax=Coniella lustricola TaxID=2025994 RepID=A0A2T2ZSI0_9PEZI|nr:calcineurin-like phosphoesterase [Coniella lustricola]